MGDKVEATMRKSPDRSQKAWDFACYVKNCRSVVVSVHFSSGQLLDLLNVGLGEVVPKISSGLPSFTIIIH